MGDRIQAQLGDFRVDATERGGLFSRVKEIMYFRLDEVGKKAVSHDKLGGKAGVEQGEPSTSKLQSKQVQVRCLITLNEMGK